MKGRIVLTAAAAVATAAAWAGALPASATTPNVLLVGTYNGYTGPYTTIQAAVDAAHPSDWILVGPGDYHEENDHVHPSQPAGVWIPVSGIHLRGMNRTGVVVDGTKPGSSECSSAPASQDTGPGGQGRNGIEVAGMTGGADGVSIENLTVCNFLTSASGDNGNEIWWNGGDGQGKIQLHGYSGAYITATSTYSSTTNGTLGACCGVDYPSGSYGIFSSDSTGYGPGQYSVWDHDYASNMADSSYYIGACQQRCDVVFENSIGEVSALCLSSTNAGGYLLVRDNECDNNKTGLVSNSQNNDDWPSPQHGQCDLGAPGEPQTGATGTTSCVVWMDNTLEYNNNPNVPGNGTSGLAGGGPVGTGLILAGSSDVTLFDNTIENNKSWGELIVDLPDNESAPSQVPTQCQGGLLYVPPPAGPLCYYQALGNVSLANVFKNNGGYGNPGNGDIGLATKLNSPGNCFSGDTDLGGMLTTDPPLIETTPANPAYQPSNGLCTQPNSGDLAVTGAEALCASNLLVPCSTQVQALCGISQQLQPYCQKLPLAVDYPAPQSRFTLSMPAASKTPTMPNPCAGVPANPFCPPAATTPELPFAASAPVAGGSLILGAAGVAAVRRRRRR